MNTQDDGGPAFPYVRSDDWEDADPGMSLLDYFAAKAMAAIVSQIGTGTGTDLEQQEQRQAVAKNSYDMAEIMLAEKQRRSEKEPK